MKTNFSNELAIHDGSNEIGLTLFKKKGIPQYFETFDLAQAEQFFNDVSRSYTRFEATRRIIIAQQDYTNGFGKEYSGGISRYHTGKNIDARFTDEVRAGPLATAIALDAYPGTIIDEGFEIWTNGTTLTNWTFSQEQGTPTQAQDSTDERSGTYCSKITLGVNEKARLTVTFSFNNNYRDKVINVIAYANRTAGTEGKLKITVFDGTDTTTGSEIDAGAGSYSAATVAHTMNSGATQLVIRLDIRTVSATGVVCIDDCWTDAPYNNEVTSWAQFNSLIYMSSGKNLFKANAGQTAFTLVDSFFREISRIFSTTVSGVDYLIICFKGWDYDNYEMIADETLTQSDLTNAEIAHITETNGVWWGSNTNSTMMSTINPLNGGTNWANSDQIGEDGYDIVSVVTFQGLPYIKKSNGKVFFIDSSGDAQVLIDGITKADGTDTAQMYVWREEALIIPQGEQGLIHYDGSTLTHIAPALFMNNATDFSGSIQAVTGDQMCLYIVMDDGNDVQIMSSKIGASVADWGWHVYRTLTITNCKSTFIGTVLKRRMWVGSTVGTESVNWIPITTKYGDIANDSDYKYQTGGYIETSWQTVDLPEDTKAWLKLTVRMSGTTDDIYWRAYYKILGGSWTEINSTPKFKDSPQTSADISTGTSPTTSTMMKLKFEAVTDSTSTSPVLLGWKLEALWYPDEHKLIALTVLVDKLIPNTMGMRSPVQASTIISALDNINSSSWRAFYPPYWEKDDNPFYVKKLPIDRGLELIQLDKGNAKEGEAAYVYHLLLEVIAVS